MQDRYWYLPSFAFFLLLADWIIQLTRAGGALAKTAAVCATAVRTSRRALIASVSCATARQTRGRPQDIADAILFPMKNGFVTGITLTSDCGRLLA